MIVYILMGIEIVLIKYLTDILFIDPFLILFIKGAIGSIAFIFITTYFNGDKLQYFFFCEKLFIKLLTIKFYEYLF